MLFRSLQINKSSSLRSDSSTLPTISTVQTVADKTADKTAKGGSTVDSSRLDTIVTVKDNAIQLSDPVLSYSSTYSSETKEHMKSNPIINKKNQNVENKKDENENNNGNGSSSEFDDNACDSATISLQDPDISLQSPVATRASPQSTAESVSSSASKDQNYSYDKNVTILFSPPTTLPQSLSHTLPLTPSQSLTQSQSLPQTPSGEYSGTGLLTSPNPSSSSSSPSPVSTSSLSNQTTPNNNQTQTTRTSPNQNSNLIQNLNQSQISPKNNLNNLQNNSPNPQPLNVKRGSQLPTPKPRFSSNGGSTILSSPTPSLSGLSTTNTPSPTAPVNTTKPKSIKRLSK